MNYIWNNLLKNNKNENYDDNNSDENIAIYIDDIDNNNDHDLQFYNKKIKNFNQSILELEIENKSESDSDSESETETNPEYNLENFIIEESKRIYNHNSYYCQILWSGIEYIDHWDLQRKLNIEHAKSIVNQMKLDYKKNKKFTFYDVVHLAKKPDGKYYTIDGQHRLIAYNNLCLKNLYPIQKIPAVIWNVNSDQEFLEIYEKINKRVFFDVTPYPKKILDIIFQIEQSFNKITIVWGKNRPKINKQLFIEEMKTNDFVHKLDADIIVKKIIDINNNLRSLPRSKRTTDKISTKVHINAEESDFFLGYDKNLKWIHDIK
jgi:hypothetical protein